MTSQSTLLSVRAPVLLGLAALLALLAGFGVWATQTKLAGAVRVQGQIAGEEARQIVQHPEGGVVTTVRVRDGDSVEAGETLLQLDDRALRTSLSILDGQLSELAARTARLTAERDGAPTPSFPPDLLTRATTSAEVAAQIDGQLRMFVARRETLVESAGLLRRRIGQTRAEADGILAQRTALEIQQTLIEAERASKQSLLDGGLVAQTTVLALRREAARLAGQIGELVASLAQLDHQATEIEIQISGLTTRRREEAATELRDIGLLAFQLAQERHALADRIEALTLRAPVTGIVLGLAVTTPQAVLRPAEPALYLVPQGSPSGVTARITPAQIDSVTVGQPADLVLSALPSAETPRLAGRVVLVSADALTDPQTGAAYFLVRIELDTGQAARLGDKTLMPGMPVEVFLQTGDRTPMAYLLEPFTAYFSRALRES